MLLSSLIQESGRPLTLSGADLSIDRLTDDSRQAGRGCLFAATRTGRAFLESALQAGSAAVLVPRAFQTTLPVALLSGPRRPDFELGHLASAFYGHPSRKLHIVAVTGTNGKTTTTHMLYHIWKTSGLPAAIVGTLGVRLFDGRSETTFQTGFTTPRSYELHRMLREMVDRGIQRLAMEASSEALSLGRMEGIRPDTVLFTGFGRDHLDHHHTLSAYLRAKRHLFFLCLRNPSAAFFVYREASAENALQRFADRLRPPEFRWIDEADLADPRALAQTVPTRFNRINAMLALHAAERSGIQTPRLLGFPGVPGRMEHIPLGHGLDAFVDYAHSPDALERVLAELRWIGYRRIVVVFGCGGDRDAGKRPVMGEIAFRLADACVITDDNPRTEDARAIRAQILAGMQVPAQARECADRSVAIRQGVELARQMLAEISAVVSATFAGIKDAVRADSGSFIGGPVSELPEAGAAGSTANRMVALVVAGKGHEDYQIIGKEKRHFSDREEIEKCRESHGFDRASSDSTDH